MSGLPSGYTQLEYIQSSGTQYINTGFKPNQNTRAALTVDAKPSTAAAWLFGARNGNTDRTFGLLSFNSKYRSDYNNSTEEYSTVTPSGKFTVDKDKNVTKFNGTIGVTAKSGVFQCTYPMFLFANNNAGTAAGFGSFKLYVCQLYDNGTLIRDFVPCKNASGVIGLYDTVGRQFYANAGTGTFTAGPEVVYEPDAPTNFTASVSGQTVSLSWAAAANAAGYRLKRDGVQIADQTGTTYTDTVPDGTTLCTYALTAYNDAGESAAVTLLVLVQLELITDRTRADVANQTDKGFYNASDLNRVGAAVEYIADRFTALGYDCPVTVKKDWLTSDAPTASQLETYRQNIVTLRSRIAVMASTPEAPASMAGLDYVKANNIEQILLDLDALITNITKSWYFSGELYAGEV